MKELDIVRAKKDLSKSVLRGCMGTIVFVYEKPRSAYEVEFFNQNGDTIELLTVEREDIILDESMYTGIGN